MQEVNEMRIQKTVAILLVIVAVVLAIVGGFLLKAGLTTPQIGRKICFLICVGLIALLIASLFYLLWLSRDKEPNYFLFNRSTGKNIPLEELTFSVVNEKMTLYISVNFEDSGKLWLGNAWARGDRFGANGEYRGLVAFKMLYDLIDADQAVQWGYFANASENTVARLCDVLARCGEKTLVQKLMYLKQNCGVETAPVRSLLMSRKKYLEDKMTGLVRRNIEWFYYT